MFNIVYYEYIITISLWPCSVCFGKMMIHQSSEPLLVARRFAQRKLVALKTSRTTPRRLGCNTALSINE